jgi:DDE superfamily endonuclease
VIADTLSAHKSKPVMDFLAVHPKVHLHFTPTYSSWLNQVELWFSKIERDVIARGVFTSVSDLKRKLMRYIRQYKKSPRTVSGNMPIHRAISVHNQLVQATRIPIESLLSPTGQFSGSGSVCFPIKSKLTHYAVSNCS